VILPPDRIPDLDVNWARGLYDSDSFIVQVEVLFNRHVTEADLAFLRSIGTEGMAVGGRPSDLFHDRVHVLLPDPAIPELRKWEGVEEVTGRRSRCPPGETEAVRGSRRAPEETGGGRAACPKVLDLQPSPPQCRVETRSGALSRGRVSGAGPPSSPSGHSFLQAGRFR